MMDSLEMYGIRSDLRGMNIDSRKNNRNQSMDAKRLGLGEIAEQNEELDSISVKDVLALAGRIKRRRRADEQDLLRLSRAFLQSADNINVFTNTTGALNVIVKELTGTEMDIQLLACECLCNLSLGPEVACAKVALSASSYLLTFLESSYPRLQIISLWTLANLCASGGSDTARILISQTIVSKLISLFTDFMHSVDITTEVYQTINIILHKHVDWVRFHVDGNPVVASLTRMLQTKPVNSWAAAELLYRTLEAYEYNIDSALRLEAVRVLSDCMIHSIKAGYNDQDGLVRIVKQCVFSLRAIGNAIVGDVTGISTMKSIVDEYENFFQMILRLDDVLAKDVLWVAAVIEYKDIVNLSIPKSIRSGILQ